MIDGLIGGKMRGTATEKTGSTGKKYVVAKLRVHVGDGDVFANVICFSETTGAALLALGDGDAVALAGTIKPGAWLDKEGTPRPSLDVVASQVLTAYHVTRKRKSIQGDDGHRPTEKPSHDAWKARQLKPDHSGLDDGSPLDF